MLFCWRLHSFQPWMFSCLAYHFQWNELWSVKQACVHSSALLHSLHTKKIDIWMHLADCIQFVLARKQKQIWWWRWLWKNRRNDKKKLIIPFEANVTRLEARQLSVICWDSIFGFAYQNTKFIEQSLFPSVKWIKVQLAVWTQKNETIINEIPFFMRNVKTKRAIVELGGKLNYMMNQSSMPNIT